MKEQLEKIYSDAVADIEKAATVKDLEDIKFKYLSRKGEFNEIKKGLKDLSPEDKRVVGSLANDITKKLESSISEKFHLFYEQELNKKLEKERLDVTLPGQFIPRGHVHPFPSHIIHWTSISAEGSVNGKKLLLNLVGRLAPK